VDPGAVLCFLLFVVFAALGAAGAVVRRSVVRRRQRGLREWAEHNGWTYAETPHTDWGSRLPGGDPAGVRHALSGTVDGRAVVVGEYAYSYTSRLASTTDSRRTITYEFVVATVSIAHQYPAFGVHRRDAWSKLGRSLAGGGEPVLGYEPFDRQYYLVADNPVDISRWLTPPLVTEHVEGRAPLWSLRGRDLLIYREGRIFDPERILVAAQEAVRMAQFLGLLR
jgi:hypothetical protein